MSLLGAIKNQIEIKLANRSQSSKRKWLIKHGCRMGENVHFNCSVKAFGTEPYLIKIGGVPVCRGDSLDYA